MSHYKPYPAYKDSGVEWICKVPEHWTVCRLKHLGTLKGGAGFPPHLQRQNGNELPFYKVSDLAKSADGVNLGQTENTIMYEQAKALGATVFPEGALAWAKIGAALSLNRRRIAQRPCCLDNNMTGFTVNGTIASVAYCYYLMSIVDFSVHARPGAVPSFSEGDQGELPVPRPPRSEQDLIANVIRKGAARIDALIAKKTEFIRTPQEKDCRSGFSTPGFAQSKVGPTFTCL